MKVILTTVILSFVLHSAQAQFLVGGGPTIEYNDSAYGMQVRIQYEFHENYIVSAKAQYYFCCGNFTMFNFDIIADLAEVGKKSEIRYFVGLNLFPGKTLEVLGVKFRGKLLHGLNGGLEYYTKIFNQHINVSAKYIYGKGYRDFGLTGTVMF